MDKNIIITGPDALPSSTWQLLFMVSADVIHMIIIWAMPVATELTATTSTTKFKTLWRRWGASCPDVQFFNKGGNVILADGLTVNRGDVISFATRTFD